ADIGNIIAFLLHPESEWKLPQQEFARALRQRSIQDLAVLAVRPVPADAHARSPVPFLLAVVVESKLIRPPVICRPGRVAALEEEITGAVVAHDEDDVTLQAFLLGCQFSEVNSTWPIMRDREL